MIKGCVSTSIPNNLKISYYYFQLREVMLKELGIIAQDVTSG